MQLIGEYFFAFIYAFAAERYCLCSAVGISTLYEEARQLFHKTSLPYPYYGASTTPYFSKTLQSQVVILFAPIDHEILVKNVMAREKSQKVRGIKQSYIEGKIFAETLHR